MPDREHELTDEEINEVQQSWDMMTRSEGGLRDAGLMLNRQLLTAHPHHLRSFAKFKKYKDIDDIFKSPEFKQHSYSTVREMSLVITNLKHPGVFTQQAKSIGFAHRRASLPPNQMVDFKSVFINDFIPSQMADKSTPNTIKAWEKFMTVFIDHVIEGIEMQVEPTKKSLNKTQNRAANNDANTNANTEGNMLGSHEETGMVTAVTSSIVLTPSKTEMKRRKKKTKSSGCCCCC